MERTEPKSFAQIYAEAIDKVGMKDTFDRQQAAFLWAEIVGEGVNRLTTRRYVEGRILHVYITSASLKNELRFHRDSIVGNINQRIGRKVIDDIMFH